jgi:hypothetical protein
MSNNIINYTHHDELNIFDFISLHGQEFKRKLTAGTFGAVRLLKNKEVIKDKMSRDGFITNMAIATGREFTAQSIVKKHPPTSRFGNISNYKVDAFGIGSGGATDDGTVTLLGPALGDKGLYTPLKINTNCLDVVDNAGTIRQHIVKHIESPGPGNRAGTITFEMSNNIEFTSLPDEYFTVIKFVCVIDHTEPTNIEYGDPGVKVSEAMLFLTSPTNTNPLPFAHVCFSPKWIEKNSIFEIEWYIIT